MMNIRWDNLIPGEVAGEPYDQPAQETQGSGWFLKTLDVVDSGLQLFNKKNQPVQPDTSKTPSVRPLLVGGAVVLVIVLVAVMIMRKK